MPSLASAAWAAVSRELRVGDRGSLRAHVIRSGGGALALNVTSRFLGMVIGVLLARTLGASHYGIYTYAFALLELLKVPTTLGLPAVIGRYVVVYGVQEDRGRLRGLLVRADQAVLGVSLVLMLVAGGATWLLSDWFENRQALTIFWLALPLLPIAGLGAMRDAALTGLHRVILAKIPETVIRPLAFLGLLGTSWLLGSGSLTAELAVGLQVVAVGCAFLFSVISLLRSLPPEVRSATPVYEMRAWVVGALPFLFMGGLQLVNSQTDIIMLGWFGVSADVGVYRVVSLSAGLVLFAFVGPHAVLYPIIAQLHTEGSMARLQRLATLSTRAFLLCSLPVGLSFIFFGRGILSVIFGPEYAAGATALAILASAQLVHANMIMAGPLLAMTGHAQHEAKVSIISALLNVTLNAALIPLWGINGAALASAASLIVHDVLVTVLVRRRLGLHPTAFGPPLHARQNRRSSGPYP